MTSIGVVGAGAWGTALAQVFASDKRDVTIWAREEEVVNAINEKHENTVFLPGIDLHPSLRATTSIEEISSQNIILMVSPAQYFRASLEQMKPHINEGTYIVICAKGIEISSGLLMSQVAHEVMPKGDFAILTGPTFASEIAQGLPGAVTIGTYSPSTGTALLKELSTPTFRPYLSDDVLGVQLGGALKNVVAIASGIVEGKHLGESARAALMTRGITEMARLGVSLGARHETLLGMCGIGDLMLTASSMQSRNFSLGAEIGAGRTMQEILSTRNAVTEGVHTAQAVIELAHKHGIEMPICQAVNDILTDKITIDEAIDKLLERPLKTELGEFEEAS